MHSTNQIIKFVLIMTGIVAIILAALQTGLKSRHELNEAIYAKKAVLAAVQDKLPKQGDKVVKANSLGTEEVQEIFTQQIKQEVFDMNGTLMTKEQVINAGYKGGQAEDVDIAKEAKKPEAERLLPMYTFTDDKGEKTYILSVNGKGLWDRIWGNIALKSDGKTIAGVDFDHAGETPGLGAEIKDNAAWKKQFIGKTIYDAAGGFRGVGVIKGKAKELDWQVDGISGATITADGVEEMMQRGLDYYSPVLSKLNKK